MHLYIGPIEQKLKTFTHMIVLITLPRTNNPLLKIVLEGDRHGEDLFESERPPHDSLIDKQGIGIVVYANTQCYKNQLVPLERNH